MTANFLGEKGMEWIAIAYWDEASKFQRDALKRLRPEIRLFGTSHLVRAMVHVYFVSLRTAPPGKMHGFDMRHQIIPTQVFAHWVPRRMPRFYEGSCETTSEELARFADPSVVPKEILDEPPACYERSRYEFKWWQFYRLCREKPEIYYTPEPDEIPDDGYEPKGPDLYGGEERGGHVCAPLGRKLFRLMQLGTPG